MAKKKNNTRGELHVSIGGLTVKVNGKTVVTSGPASIHRKLKNGVWMDVPKRKAKS